MFTFENDKFLVYFCFKHNYGNWKDIRTSIKKEPLFRFDTFFRSRNEQDINKRMQSIIKMLEKEKDFNKTREENVKNEQRERKKKEREAKQILK